MGEIKAIETIYNGYRFRSRLEARWAVFFDAAGIKYEYEPDGYVSDKTKYLPDFYLPDFDLYVEVKRDTPEGMKEISEKCVNAIEWGGPIKQILVLSNVPVRKSEDGGIWHYPIVFWKARGITWGWWFFHDNDDIVVGNIGSADYPFSEWYLSHVKKSIQAVSDYELRKYRDPTWRGYTDITTEEDIDIQMTFNEMTFSALRKARQARFEHGETPKAKRVKKTILQEDE